MGISGVVSSLLGVATFPAFVNWLVPLAGWRFTYMVLGAILLFVMALLGYLFFRERPEQYGLHPDGFQPVTDAEGVGFFHPPEVNWTLGEATRTLAFWMVSLSTGLLAVLSTGLFFHMVSIFTDQNLPASVAAAVYTPIAITTAATTLGSGILVDRLPLRGVLATSLFLMAASMWLAQSLTSTTVAVMYGIVLGASQGLFRTITVVALAHYFGRQHLGSISGASLTIMIIGAALGPIPLNSVPQQPQRKYRISSCP